MIEDRLGHRALLWLIFRIALDDFFLQRVDGGVARALFLARRIERCAQTFRVVPLNLSHHLFVKSRRRHRAFLDVESLVQFLLPTTQPINFLVGEHQRFNHNRFRNFLGSGFDHDDRLFGARDD